MSMPVKPSSISPAPLPTVAEETATPVSAFGRRVAQSPSRSGSPVRDTLPPGVNPRYMEVYPHGHRQRLEKSLNPDSTRQHLETVCEHLAPDSAQRARLERLAEDKLTAPELFATLVRQRVLTDRFSAQCSVLKQDSGTFVTHLAASPDGQYMAAAMVSRSGPLSQNSTDVCIWQTDTSTISQQAIFHCDQSLQALAFGADSHTLQAIDSRNLIYRWQADVETGLWRSTGDTTACPKAYVREAVISPDGDCLGMVDHIQGHGFLCTATKAGSWKTERLAQPQTAGMFQNLHSLAFSENSQVFSYAAPSGVFVYHRTGEDWKVYPLENTSGTGPCLAPDGRTLALYQPPSWSSSHAEAVPIGKGTVHLWRFTESEGWRCRYVRELDPSVASAGRFPMVFSSDSRQLAMPAEGNARGAFPSFPCTPSVISSISSARPTQVQLRLHTEAQRALRPQMSGNIGQLAFSATGRYLASSAEAGVHIWRRDRGLEWAPIAWIVHEQPQAIGKTDVRPVFSPDGYHCAFAMARLIAGRGFLGESHAVVRVWGPGSQGDYKEKVQIQLEGRTVDKLQFTSNGVALVIASSAFGVDRSGSAQTHYLPLVAAEPEATGDRQV